MRKTPAKIFCILTICLLLYSTSSYSSSWKSVKMFEPTKESILDIRYVYADSKGNLWVARFAELYMYNGKDWTKFSIDECNYDRFINSIFEDSKGNLWFNAENGVVKYDGKEWVAYNLEDRSYNVYINSINEDSAGNIWACGAHSIHKFNGKNWNSLYVYDNSFSFRKFIIDSNDVFWFCTDNGIIGVNQNKIKRYTNKDRISNSFICALQIDSNRIWFGSDDGVMEYADSLWNYMTFEKYFPFQIVTAFIKDNEQNIWIGTQPIAPISESDKNAGLIRFNGSDWEIYPCPTNLEFWFVTSLAKTNDGKIWVGTYNNGLLEFTP